MATDGPTPPNCDPEIFKNGHTICTLDGSSNAIERWVKSLTQETDARLDWHYCGGVGNVLHLGDDESRERVISALRSRFSAEREESNPRIMSISGDNLFRAGVHEFPEDAIAYAHDVGFMAAEPTQS